MAVRPNATNQQQEADLRGSGQLGKSTDFLKNDPASYYYQKFKDQGNKYLRDDMWSEAAKRGETAVLIDNLQRSAKFDSIGVFDKWESYEGQHDYDGYMLSLAIPNLDNTEKKERKDEESGHVFGQYTDQEWALEILNRTFQGYDAKIIEENKENTNFFVKVGAYIASGVNHVASGVSGFMQDVSNIGEGLINMFANFSDDSNWGDRFLWAFSNDEGQLFEELKQYFSFVAFDYERRYTSVVNAEHAFEQGFSLGNSSNYLDMIDKTVGVGAGYTTWGRWWSAGTESIGYMLPSMLIPAGSLGKAAGAVKQGVFYSGIFSGNVKDTVSRVTMNGGTYRDLNAGVVVANAALKAGAQLAIEKALGMVMGFSGLDKMMGVGSKSVAKNISAASKTGLKAVGNVAARIGKDMLKEGLEELFQDMSDGIIDAAFGGDYLARGLETLTVQNLVDAFVVGALVSGVTSVVNSVSVVLPSQRAIASDADGKLYRMGPAQTLNFREAMSVMNEWNNTLNDKKASAQAKADAAFKMSVAMDTVGSVLKSMGSDRAIMANQTLMAQLDVEATREAAIAQMSAPEYATNLYETFQKHNAEIAQRYVTEQTEKKIKKAAESLVAKLKKKGISAIKDIITKKTKGADPDVNTTQEVTQTVQTAMSGIGAEAIVGVDGAIVAKSGDIVFVDNKLIQAGDVAEIIRGIAYDQVQETVASKLSAAQKKMLLTQYEKITGTTGDIDAAITALLFDKNFYTNILLLSGERRYKMPAIEMLATVDKLVKAQVSQDLANGKTSDAAYKLVMERIQQTMRAGLVTYATQYGKLDLGEISNDVLSAELKQEITDHRNSFFTAAIDEGMANTSNTKPTTEHIRAFDTMIDRFVTKLTAEQIESAKQKARSTNYNERVDAYTLLTQLAKSDAKGQADKLIYLPSDPTGTVENQHIATVETFFGADWYALLEGTYSATDLTREASDFIMANGYDMSDKVSRLAAIREVLFNKSNKTLTIGSDGTVLGILEKTEFLRDKFAGPKGDQTLKNAILSGEVKTLGDLSKAKLPAEIANIAVRIDPNLRGINGYYVDGATEIVLSGRSIINTIMHEATHATQFQFAIGMEDIQGGSTGAFNALPSEVINSLDTYLSDNFPLTYNYMKEHKVTTPQVVYFMLSGELQANSTMTTHMFEVGFRWKNDRTELVSPDGKQTWSMKPGVAEGTQALLDAIKKQPKKKKAAPADTTVDTTTEAPTDTSGPDGVNMDAPLTRSAKEQLRDDQATQQYMQNGFLKTKDGTPIVMYRGSESGNFETQGSRNNVRRLGEFYTTSHSEASAYGPTRGYISNVPRSKTVVYDAKGSDFVDVGSLLSPDQRARQKALHDQYAKFTQLLPQSADALTIDQADRAIRDALPNNERAQWDAAIADAMSKYNLDRDKAIKFIVGTELLGNYSGIESLLPLAIADGKDAIVVKNVVDGTGRTVNEIILLSPGLQKRVTFNRSEIAWDKTVGDKGRYISNKVAAESNLKYWIKKGRQIQLDPGVANFVVATTADFEKLPPVLKKKIQAASLTKYDIIDYVATASRMSDYTFQMIAQHVFGNEELAKIKYKDMRAIMDQIEEFAAMAYLVEDNQRHMSPAEFAQEFKAMMAEVNKNSALGEKFVKALKRAQTVKLFANGKSEYVEAHADTKQLNSAFFRHYDGTLASIRNINNLGKFMSTQQAERSLIENSDTGDIDNKVTKVWNWSDKRKSATIDYEVDDVAKTLGELDRQDKINEIENYIADVIAERLRALPEAERVKKTPAALRRIEAEIAKLDGMSDVDIDKRYMQALASEAAKKKAQRSVEGVTAPASQERTTKNRKDRLRNLARTISTRIAGLKTRYNALSPEVKAYIDPNNKYKLKPDYRTLTDAELDTLISKFAEDSKALRARIALSDRAKKARANAQQRVERMARQNMKPNGQVETKPAEKKTMRQKVQVEYKTTVKQQTFEFVTPEPANSVVTKLLDTGWNTSKMSKVQGLTNNTEANVANAKTFFEENASTLMGANLGDIEAAVRWFLDTKMNNVTDPEYKKYSALKLYFLGYVLGETGSGKLFAQMDHNLKQRIENTLKSEVTVAGTMLAVWNNVRALVDPTTAMKNADMEIDGVLLTEEEKTMLFDAANSGDIPTIQQAQQKIIERIEKEKTSNKSILRKITAIRSMAMLSSPVTWLRNLVSNMALKRINKLASSIGGKLWQGKTVSGQLKMTGNITPEIQSFINEHFLDNKLFDTLVSNLSRYNPSDISSRFRDATGKASKEAIFAQMVIKSMYNEYYNENMFKSKFINDVHKKLMKVLSDNNYVREAAIRYFGKMIAEKGYDLSKNEVSDAIMNDFAVAIGLGLSDYMHSDNIFNYIETKIAETSELGLFAYKTLLPFASAGFQWFKAALKLSPIGLGRAIFNMATLEKRVARAEAAWAAGKSQVSPELTEYIARRDLGQGVIGTIAWTVGMLLAGFGWIDLEDDDYGKPKLRIGNLRIDVSSIFGSSSLLAGAALITGIKDKGMTWEGWLEGLNRMADVTIDGFPLMQIVEMDMYSNGTFSMGMNQLESIALSFIPNILSWFAGATYSGNLNKKTFLGRAAAKIPFLGPVFNEKKVDPYTGSQGSWWDAFNRVVPYFSIDIASQTEKDAKALGLNKSQLKGQYTVNGEEFNLSPKETTAINEAYGRWNAADIAQFYQNQTAIKIKVGKTYKTLKFNQMSDAQRKTAVQQIMQNNAEMAKIMAWTKAGNKYYASANMYTTLRRRGVTSNVYRGTKGFVSK